MNKVLGYFLILIGCFVGWVVSIPVAFLFFLGGSGFGLGMTTVLWIILCIVVMVIYSRSGKRG